MYINDRIFIMHKFNKDQIPIKSLTALLKKKNIKYE